MATEILLNDVVRRTGAKSDSKTRQMRKAVRNGGKFPPIRVALIDDTLRKKLGRMGLATTGKKYFLLEGHHRLCAMESQGKEAIRAKIVRKLY